MANQVPPIEYLRLLRAVVQCVTGNGSDKPQNAAEIADWLRRVELNDVHEAMRLTSANGDSRAAMVRNLVSCILEETHDPRVPDWTPAQMVLWLNRISSVDVEHALAMLSVAPDSAA